MRVLLSPKIQPMKRFAVAAALLALLLPATSAHAAKPSFEDLVANLKSPNAQTRQDAASALGRSRRREAVAHLAALVRDPETKVRLEVVRALRELRDVSAVAALVTSLKDGDPDIREEAVGGIVEIYSERERNTPVDRFLRMFSDEFDRASVPPYTNVDPGVYRGLGEALRDEDATIRAEAAFALGILDGRSEMPALVQALQDPEDEVRGAAATAIGKVGTQQDGRQLIGLLADRSTTVRDRALLALGTLRVEAAGATLRELFETTRRKESGVRVLSTLSRIGDPKQADLFRELVTDGDPEKRRLAIEGLGRISDASLLAAFKKDYQREHSEDLRLAYSFALTRLGDRAFLDTIVLALPSRTLGTRAESYLLELGPDLLPDLYPYLNDPDADIRAELSDIIALIGNAESVTRLQPLLSDPSAKVVDRANRAIERIRRTEAAGRS
jgi:HEAT repeat protein